MPEVARSSSDFLLCAARELMAEVGYSAMSMRQLATRVGLQPGSLYHHVASKQDLLLDVLLDIVERRIEAWRRGTFCRDLQGYLRFALMCQRTHPGDELLLRHDSRHLQPVPRNWLDQRLKVLRQPLLVAVEADINQGRFNVQDAGSVSEAILALIDSADTLRRRAIPVDEAWIESWLMRMSLAL